MSETNRLKFVPAATMQDDGLSEEDLARSDLYGLIAECLTAPPTDDFFNRLASSTPPKEDDQTDLGRAWRELLRASLQRQPQAARDEYDSLFVAVGKPLVALHASVYLAGALNQQPLVTLRHDLAEFGIESTNAVTETEDHVSVLFEVMRFLIAPSSSPVKTLAQQHAFFSRHIGPWMTALFDAISEQPDAYFYRAVADLGRAFVEIERQAFDIYSASIDAIDPS
jgi:TorA maturation chaperone TorD